MRLRPWPMFLLSLSLVLAGCGASATTPPSGHQAAQTATAMDMSSPTVTATPSPNAPQTPGATTFDCASGRGFAGAPRLGASDLLVLGPSLNNLAYPGRKLQDKTPLKPLALTSRGALPYPSEEANPVDLSSGGYTIELCN